MVEHPQIGTYLWCWRPVDGALSDVPWLGQVRKKYNTAVDLVSATDECARVRLRDLYIAREAAFAAYLRDLRAALCYTRRDLAHSRRVWESREAGALALITACETALAKAEGHELEAVEPRVVGGRRVVILKKGSTS